MIRSALNSKSTPKETGESFQSFLRSLNNVGPNSNMFGNDMTGSVVI